MDRLHVQGVLRIPVCHVRFLFPLFSCLNGYAFFIFSYSLVYFICYLGFFVYISIFLIFFYFHLYYYAFVHLYINVFLETRT